MLFITEGLNGASTAFVSHSQPVVCHDIDFLQFS
jgi:hypothetical protein